MNACAVCQRSVFKINNIFNDIILINKNFEKIIKSTISKIELNLILSNLKKHIQKLSI